MTREKLQSYRGLFTKYRNSSTHVDPDFKLKAQNDFDALASKDTEFEKLLVHIKLTGLVRSCNRQACLHELRNFSQGKSSMLDDVSLMWTCELGQYDPMFRDECDADKALRKALNYWFDEYHRRVSTDEKFAAQVLLRKLERFPLGELGFCPPVEFDETELALLERSFHTDAEFQNMLEQETDCVRDILEYLLEERKRRVSEDKS